MATEVQDPDRLLIGLMATPQPPDPYPLYRELRETAPNHPSMLGLRFVSSYALAAELLLSRDFGQSFGLGSEGRIEKSPFLKKASEMLILTNAPQHTRLRRLVIRAFQPRVIDAMIPDIQKFIDEALDRVATAGGGDLVAELGVPVPSMMLCLLLGAPYEDRAMVQEWSDVIAEAVKPVLEDEALALADVAVAHFHDYVRGLLQERRREPKDDLLSALVAVEEEGDRLSEIELVNLLFTIMGAGTETTTSLISSGMMLLLQHPDQLALLRADPSLLSGALDEILRFEPPVQNSFMRIAFRDTTLGGVEINEGEHVAALIGAANRDPAVFADPEEFRITRTARRELHLSFGQGVHYCLGRNLGRQQAAQCISSLLARFPDLELAEEPVWRNTLPTRRLEKLVVRT